MWFILSFFYLQKGGVTVKTGEDFKQFWKEHRIFQYEVARVADVSEYTLGRWLRDLQDRPEEIINLYNKAQEGYDFVIASREHRQDSRVKVWFSKCFYSLYSWVTDVKYDPTLCNFSICKRQVIDQYRKIRESHRAYTMYLLWMGFKWTKMPVDHNERFEGKSGYDFKKRSAGSV